MEIMYDLCNPSVIRNILYPLGFHFSKSKGQNFLIDSTIPDKIATSAFTAISVKTGNTNSATLEIGPGIGALTSELSKHFKKVVSIEIDSLLVSVLKKIFDGSENISIIEADALRTDLRAVVQAHFGDCTPVVTANLPYSITSPILTSLIEADCFEQMTVMVQREVAQRLTAAPNTEAYGSFTIFVRVFYNVEILFDVPPHSFMPQPEVHSAVIRLDKHPQPLVPKEMQNLFFRITRAAFAQRRKTLLNSLSAVFPNGKEWVSDCLTKAEINPSVRGEVLGVPEFLRIASIFSNNL